MTVKFGYAFYPFYSGHTRQEKPTESQSRIGLKIRFQQILPPIIQRQDPFPPFLPIGVGSTSFETLIPDRAEFGDLLPRLAGTGASAACPKQPPSNASCCAVPARLAHQAFHGLFFGPALFYRDVWEVGGAVASTAVDEGYP